MPRRTSSLPKVLLAKKICTSAVRPRKTFILTEFKYQYQCVVVLVYVRAAFLVPVRQLWSSQAISWNQVYKEKTLMMFFLQS